MQTITRDNKKVLKQRAVEAFALLNDPDEFFRLSEPQKAELLRLTAVFLLKDRLGDELNDEIK